MTQRGNVREGGRPGAALDPETPHTFCPLKGGGAGGSRSRVPQRTDLKMIPSLH